MNKKWFILLVCIGIIITLLLLLREDEIWDPKVVYKIPEGFVPLWELDSVANNILHIHSIEDMMCFYIIKKDIEVIFVTPISNSDYFVEYKKEIYVNEVKYMKLVEVAAHALEQSQRIYNLGDEIKVLGAGETVYSRSLSTPD